MKPHSICAQQSSFLLPELSSQLDPRQPLYALALAMKWEWFEQEFGALYSPEGRPALPIRRMVGLLMLKHLHNLSDERVVEFWSLSPYAQFFCGEREMQWGMPCEASELVHFRARIGPGGAEKILAASIALHGEKAKDRPAAHILAQNFPGQCRQPLIPFAHIARLHRHAHPKAPRKTQHGLLTSSDRITSPANAACLELNTSSRTSLPISMLNPSPFPELSGSSVASIQLTAAGLLQIACPALRSFRSFPT